MKKQNIIEVIKKYKDSFDPKRIPQKYITETEASIGLKFSAEFKEYLKTFGIAAVNGHELTGISKSKRLNVVDVTISERGYNPSIPMDWYVVEQANIDGIVIWQNKKGEIFQTIPRADPIKLCDSLAEYIEM
ncbi:SMI1-KNR4 cell-wall [Ruminococcaceae bacterium FB2012]|nr:SMI1-KNR4 cell-wall [Ruminococcaceae bacterium FB2012]